MQQAETMCVGYVLKRYPRYSETFIVNEILAHEAAGLAVEIFSLRPPCDSHFQDVVARVRAPVTYLPSAGVKSADFWTAAQAAAATLPNLWAELGAAAGEDVVDVYQALLLASAVRERGITHLHAHFGSVATTVARLAAHFAGVPYTFTAHAKDIFHESVNVAGMSRKLRDAAAVVTVSEFNLDYLRQVYGRAADGVERIYNGLDLHSFRYRTPAVRPPVIVAVGRLIEKKGFGDLIGACAILAARGVAFSCRILGGGELESELREQIRRLGLGERVTLLGPQPQSEVIREVGSAAVFAAPCVIGADGNRDGLPTVLLEAMALGTPAISTAVTGIPEVLTHGETGLLVEQHDPAVLAAAIEQLLGDPALRVRLAAAARARIEDEFSISRNSARQRELFARSSVPALVAA